jgi:ribosomal protein S12 methylthiotransferase accessory factor
MVLAVPFCVLTARPNLPAAPALGRGQPRETRHDHLARRRRARLSRRPAARGPPGAVPHRRAGSHWRAGLRGGPAARSGGGATIGYGYGLSPIEAEVGALGELLEELSVARHLQAAPRVEASFAALRRARGPRGVADPRTLCLPAGSSWTEDSSLLWVEARRWPSDEAVLVPLDWVAAHPYQIGEAWRLVLPITNGLGAGFALEHAIAHGVMELLQRDGNAVSYRALDQGVVVEPDAADGDTLALLDKLRALGIGVTVKLAGDEFGIANLYVVGDDSAPGFPLRLTACGEAAHPDRARSLRKALLEFCGSRARKSSAHGPLAEVRRVMPRAMMDRQLAAALRDPQEERAVNAMAEWLAQDAEELRRRLAPTAFREARPPAALEPARRRARALGRCAGRLRWLARALERQGLEILWVDCSQAGSAVKPCASSCPGWNAKR